MAGFLTVNEALSRVQAITDNLQTALSTPGANDVGLRNQAVDQVRGIANSLSAALDPRITTYLGYSGGYLEAAGGPNAEQAARALVEQSPRLIDSNGIPRIPSVGIINDTDVAKLLSNGKFIDNFRLIAGSQQAADDLLYGSRDGSVPELRNEGQQFAAERDTDCRMGGLMIR